MERNFEQMKLLEVRFDFQRNALHVSYENKDGSIASCTKINPSQSLLNMCFNTFRLAMTEVEGREMANSKQKPSTKPEEALLDKQHYFEHYR